MAYIRKIYSVTCEACIEIVLWYNIFYICMKNKNNIEVMYVS